MASPPSETLPAKTRRTDPPKPRSRRSTASPRSNLAASAPVFRFSAFPPSSFHPMPPAPDPSAAARRAAARRREGYPTDAELLHELRLHGAKPPPRPARSGRRRLRDYFLVTLLGSGAIASGAYQLAGDAPANALKLAFTGIAVFSALLAFVFFGVMNRY